MQSGEHQYWSMTEGVFNCLIDEKRTLAFKRAIENTVHEGDVVIDMGTGSGILAMIACRAGASKVYAVEFDKKNIRTLRDTFILNGFGDKIVILEGDVTKVKLPEHVDVIIGEMIATGLIEELQVHAMNNILQYTNTGYRVLLQKYNVTCDIVQNKEQYYDFLFKIVRYEYPDEVDLASEALSDRQIIREFDFMSPVLDLAVDKTCSFTVLKNGEINALRINSDTYFSDGSSLDATFAYSYPIILPVETRPVHIGDQITAHICYTVNGGMNTLHYELT